MGRRLEQILHKRRDPNLANIYRKLLSITTYCREQSLTTMRYHYTPTRMDKIIF